jgi:hypothetical protein
MIQNCFEIMYRIIQKRNTGTSEKFSLKTSLNLMVVRLTKKKCQTALGIFRSLNPCYGKDLKQVIINISVLRADRNLQRKFLSRKA